MKPFRILDVLFVLQSPFSSFLLERRLSENADNLRGRALDMMMAGRLETGIEDELKKDIEVPDFMEKPQEKWSEDEQKQAKEYERKRTQVSISTTILYSFADFFLNFA